MEIDFAVYRGFGYCRDIEYVVQIEAIKEAIWFLGLVDDLAVVHEYVNIQCDSQSAI